MVILDDNALDHLIFGKILSRWNSTEQIQHSFDGTELIKMLQQCPETTLPDIIFLDINMPSMDGWEFLKQLKKIENNIHKLISVYVVSSSINPYDILRAKKYPFVKEYIIKPVSHEKLRTIFEHPIH
ncbi:MAG: response regulator receiver [Mucilaginibacter sp.]|nr:response regulator receiver [Mucilaginibacter sp.]